MIGRRRTRTLLQTLGIGAAVAILGVFSATTAHALNIGYYEMCLGEGKPNQVTPITAAGHTAVDVFDLSPAELAGLDALFVDNCSNDLYAQEYLDHVADVDAAVAAGLVLVMHDRYVDPAETILPGAGSFDIRRDFTNSGDREIDVLDDSTAMTNGPAGAITDTNLDGGCSSNHGFTVAGSLPDDARIILTRTDPASVVTFAYGYGRGVVVYSSIPLDFYLDGNSCTIGPTVRDVYAVNAVTYAAALSESKCGNGVIDAGEACDLGAGNNGETCCAFDCSLRGAGDVCRAGDLCDPAEVCDGSSAVCPADVLEPATTVCRPATGICDIAESCTGVDKACPADQLQPDTDADTVCDLIDNCVDAPNVGQADTDGDGEGDACDACTAVTPAIQGKGTKIVVAKENTAPGDDKLIVVGSFTGVPESPALDPVAHGVRILLDKATGGVMDATIPGGGYDRNTKVGWKGNATGTSFKYVNGSPLLIDGINGISIRKTKNPGEVKFTIRGKKGSYPIGTLETPVKATLVLDPPLATTGQCTETAFTSATCLFNRSGATVTCK